MFEPDWVGKAPQENDTPDEYDRDDYYYNQSKDK
jgi:hypothetical protein